MPSPFYANLGRDSQLKNPNVTMNLWVALNTNRNASRTTQGKEFRSIPANNSVNLLDWISYISKRTSPISNGSYSGPAAAFSAGLSEGDIFYNTTTGKLEAVLGQGAYADDTAAGSGGVAVGEHYYNTGSNSYVTKMT